MVELAPLLENYLSALTAFEPGLPPSLPRPEPGRAARLVLSGPRGCGKTTALRAQATGLARQALECAARPLADVLWPLLETPLYLDLGRWRGSLLDTAAAALAPDDLAAGRPLAQAILNGPVYLLLDHLESLPPACARALGQELATLQAMASVWVAWRALPSRAAPRWLTAWPTIALNDWNDAQVIHAITALFDPQLAPRVARRLTADPQVWQAIHRPLYFQAIAQAIQGSEAQWPSRAELARQALAALLNLEQLRELDDWFAHAGFGVCRLAWAMLEQDTDALSADEAMRVVQEAQGADGLALVEAGVLTLADGMVAFDQPLVQNLCAAWYARARPERFGGGEQAAIGRAGRARALHHALDLAQDSVAVLVAALQPTAPPAMFQAAANWLAALPPERAHKTLTAFARSGSAETLILLARQLGQNELAACAAELARSMLRTAQDPNALAGAAAPQTWRALRRAASNTLRAAIEACADRPQAALHCVEAALAASAAATAWLAQELGAALVARDNLPAALQAFEMAISLQPEEAAHYIAAGRAAIQQNEPTKSLDYLQRARELAQGGDVWLALGRAHLRLGQHEAARNCAAQAETLLDQAAADDWHQLGQLWAALDEPKRAVRAWQHCLAFQPAQTDWCVDLSHALVDCGQTAEAIDICRQALIFAPDEISIHRALGRACLQAGEPAQAAHHLTIALRAQPDDVELALLCADSLARAGQVQEAIAAFERVLNLRPGDLRAAVGLARLYAEHDRPADAQAILDWVQGRQADYPPALAVQGLLAEKRNDLEQACQLYARALAAADDVELRLQCARLGRQLGQLDRARAEATACGDHPDALRELARLDLLQGQPWQAIEHLRQIAQADAETLDLWAQAYLQAHEPQTALAVLARAIAEHGASPTMLEGVGHALEHLGRFTSAILAYKYVVSLAPTRSSAYCALGRLYRRAGNLDESIAVLSQAVHLAPDDAACCTELGESLAQLQRWGEAEAQFARATSLAPGNADYWRWHGRALRRLERFDAAARSLERARQLEDSAAAHIELAWLYHDLGDAPRALAALEQACRTSDIATLIDIARTLREFGEPARAQDLLLEAGANATPQQMAAVQVELGYARLTQNQVELALTAFEQATTLDPQRGEYHAALARALAELGRLEAAVQEWNIARANGYETAELLQRQADTLSALNRHAEALTVYERLVELEPRDARAYLAAAWAARNAGNVERALALAGWATSLEPDLAPAYVLIGQICLENGRPEEALTALKRASTLAQDRPVLLGLANAALDSGQAETALQAAQTMLAHNADDADAYLIKGIAHLARGEWQAAARAFSETLARRPENPDAALGLARAVAVAGIRAEIARRENAPSQLPAPSELETALAVLPHVKLEAGLEVCERVILQAVLTSLRGDAAQAAGRLKTLMTQPELTAKALYGIAIVLRRAGMAQLGRGAISRAAWLDRGNAWVLYELGATLENDKNIRSNMRRAHSAYARAAALEPDNALFVHALARVHRALDENGLARQALEAAISKSPDVAGWHQELGQVCAEQNDLEAAARAFEQACRLEPSAERHHQLGQIYARLERYAVAATELEAALRSSPTQAEWWVELGDLHHEHGAGARALLCYKQALRYMPDDVNLVLSAVQLTCELGRWDEALGIVRAALARTAAVAPLHAQAGLIHERLGQPERALEAFRRAAQLAPHIVAHHLEAGRLALQLNQPEIAAPHLEATIRADRQQRAAYGLLGDAYLALGRQDEALQVYQHAATLEPANVAHRLRLGRLYRRRGALDQALAHLQVAVSLAPTDVTVLEEMIAVHQDRREYRQALHVCLQLIQLRSEANDYFCAGTLYKQLKEYPQALDMFRRATRLSPNHAEAYKQIAVVSAIEFFSR